MTTNSTSGPLKDNGEVRMCNSDIDDLSNALDGTWLEGHVLDASSLESSDNLCSLVGGRNTNRNAEFSNRHAFALECLPGRMLEAELARVDAEQAEV